MKALSLSVFGLMLTCVLGVTVNQESYYSQEELEEFLDAVHQEYPNITHLYDIGKSVEERRLIVIAIAGESPDKHVLLRPELKYVGNMHGNEAVGRSVLINFIYELTSKYGEWDNVTTLLDTRRVHILVTMNPDGFSIADTAPENETCAGVTGRYNANGIDLNRNFPDFFQDNDSPIQPETQVIMDWFDTLQFFLSANLHGGAVLANYPYDNLKNPTPGVAAPTKEDDVFVEISTAYASNHLTMATGINCSKWWHYFEGGITNGVAWYPATGGMQDYNYNYHGIYEITLEISCCKYPKESELPSYWDQNRESMLAYLETSYMGVKGLVLDENNNAIQGATVEMEGRNNPSKTTPHGEYWKLALPGSYTLKVSTKGYKTKTQKFTITEKLSQLVVNVALEKDDISGANPQGYNLGLVFVVQVAVMVLGMSF